MSEDELMNVEGAEIEALDDQELDSVAGGLDEGPTITTVHSCMCCCGCGSISSEEEGGGES